MEYIDYCPNCNQQLTIEEHTNNYVFKYNGRPTRHCPNPKCGMLLEVVNGEVSVIEENNGQNT